MRSVWFSRASEEWIVDGADQRGGDDGELVLMGEQLDILSATDVKNALRSAAEFYDVESQRALISEVPEEFFDEGPYRNVSLEWERGELKVVFTHMCDYPEVQAEVDAIGQALEKLLQPRATSFGAAVSSIVQDEWFMAPVLAYTVRVRVPTRAKRMDEIIQLAEDLERLANVFSTGKVDRAAAADLIRGGAGHLMLGLEEGPWLETKSQEYALRTTRGDISLAQAVARFCNAEDGGLIIIGAAAKKRAAGKEVITGMRGVSAEPGREQAYFSVLNRCLFPFPFGITIEQIETSEGRSIILIDIPAQPEELKPFLVHGAILGDDYTEGVFISIVQRRGEGSVPHTAAMIHSTLAAGRALLRGTYRP